MDVDRLADVIEAALNEYMPIPENPRSVHVAARLIAFDVLREMALVEADLGD